MKIRKHRNHRAAAARRRMSAFLRAFADVAGWKKRPRNSKVARLPEPVRLAINHMLDDGLPYRTILAQLHHSLVPSSQFQFLSVSASQLLLSISEQNLSNWFHGGYQDWLRDQTLSRVPTRLGPPGSLDHWTRRATPDRGAPHQIAPNRTKSHQLKVSF